MRQWRTNNTSSKQKLRRLFIAAYLLIGSMCLMYLGLCIFVPVHVTSPAVNSVSVNITPKVSVPADPIADPPVRLQITSINVDATINPVGLTSTGAMNIDENPDQVAWYQYGTYPGNVGSAVIAGHYGWEQNGHASVFNNLNLLKVGDIVSTYDGAGIQADFIVRGTRLYDPEADATEVFTSSDGKAHLNLITCQGMWISAKDSYSNRLVVFTDAVQK